MSRYHLLPLEAVDSDLPYTESSLYTLKARGKIDWLSRVGPTGQAGRSLWVHIERYNTDSARRGHKHRLRVNHPRAVLVEEMEEGAR